MSARHPATRSGRDAAAVTTADADGVGAATGTHAVAANTSAAAKYLKITTVG